METNPELPASQILDSSQASNFELPESMWQLKPWWCQPWSIVLTGIIIPVVSWLLLHRLWVTVPVASVVLVWWLLFLVLVPTQYAAAVREQASS